MMKFNPEWLDKHARIMGKDIRSCLAVDTEGRGYPGEIDVELDPPNVKATASWHNEDIADGAGIVSMKMFDKDGLLVCADTLEAPIVLIEDIGIYTQASFYLNDQGQFEVEEVRHGYL